MPWFKVDDQFHAHPKVVGLGRDRSSALALWVLAGSWASNYLTEGFIPTHMLAQFGTRKAADALVRVGLWTTVEGGWQYHDWAEQNPTREQVLEQRADNAERQQRYRDRTKAHARGDHSLCDARYCPALKALREHNELRNALRNGPVTPTRPDPTRPDPSPPKGGQGPGSGGDAVPARHEAEPAPPSEPAATPEQRAAIAAEHHARRTLSVPGSGAQPPQDQSEPHSPTPRHPERSESRTAPHEASR